MMKNSASPQSVNDLAQTSHVVSKYKKEIVEVVFGTPSKNCAGMGICMVARPNSSLLRNIACPSVLSTINYMDAQKICFEFHRDDIGSAIVVQRFLESYFMIEEPFKLPIYLAHRWQLTSPWVAAGLYPLSFQNGVWRIPCVIDAMVQTTGLNIRNNAIDYGLSIVIDS